MFDLLIRDATIVRPSGRLVADIGIKNGKITFVGGRPFFGAKQEFSAIGKFVMPGVIDPHVHFRDPGFPHKEDWASGSRDAVANGVTTVLDMPNTKPASTNRSALKAKIESASRTSVVSFGLWAGASSDNVDQLDALVDEGLACGIKVYACNSTGNLGVNDKVIEALFENTRSMLAFHAEDPAIIAEMAKRLADDPNPIHNDVRPPEAAVESVKRLVELVKKHDRAIHICHLSTAGELAVLDPYRGVLPITCEVTPHHLYLSTDNHEEFGNLIKMNPPIRPELDRRALWTAVKRGRVDMFASDHAPHTREEKSRGYWKSPAGIPGVGTLYSLLMTAVKNGRLGMELVVEMCCEAPARVFGLKQKGKVEEGMDADLILFTEGATSKLSREDLHTRVGWTPYLGRELAAAPDIVIVNGRVVARRGKLADDLKPARHVEYARG